MLLLSDYADLMPLLHPDYPTGTSGLDALYEDHLERVAEYVRAKQDEAWGYGYNAGDIGDVNNPYRDDRARSDARS